MSSPNVTWAAVEAVKGTPLEQDCIQWGAPGPLGELCPEFFQSDDQRPACSGDWNNHTAEWSQACEKCPAWMLNQKQGER